MKPKNKRLSMFLELALMPRLCHRLGATLPRAWHNFAIGMALFCFALSSCTQDDSFPGGNDEGRTALLGISTLQANDIDVSNPATRAVATPDYPTTGSVGFFVKADAANGYKAVSNRKGTYSTARNLWLPQAATPADSIWLNSHDADVAIYAPYSATHVTASTLNLTAALRPADGSKDIWCKRFAANNKSKSLAVTLEHLYTRLTVVVSRDGNYKSDANLTALALKGNEIYESATYKPFETAPYTNSSSTGLTPAVTPQTLNASTASATYDLLLIPATLTGDITLTLTVDGKKMQVKVAKEKFTGNKLEAGKQYNVNLKLKPGKLEITSVSVVKWDVLTEVSGGQAEFDEYMDGIDIGLNFYIAKGNVQIGSGGGSGYTYAFAEEQGYYSGTYGGGDYFCWNSLEASGNVTQSSWEDARDPCRKIGDRNWHTPTQVQLQALVNAGSVWGENIYTMKDGTTVNGRYFGATTIPAKEDQDKYVFLPAAGDRDSGGSAGDDTTPTDYAGTYGYYWSSDNYDGSSGHDLYFYSGGANIDYANKGYGFSIRCVKEKP